MSPSPGVVLVALDGSREATRALPVARAVAAQLGASVEALHVAAAPVGGEDLRAALRLDQPGTEGIPVRVRTGEPAGAILRELTQPEVELLVMTTRAAGDPDREFGSIARQVAIATQRPVLGFPPEVGADPSTTARPLRRLLVPLDGTRTTASALSPVVPLARRLGAAVDIVYIAAPHTPPSGEPGSMAGPRYVDQPHHEWSTWADELKQRLCFECAGFSQGMDIGVHLREGEPGAEIVRFAREGRYDAIVLVRRSRLEPDRARTLRKVVRESPCPILVIGGPP